MLWSRFEEKRKQQEQLNIFPILKAQLGVSLLKKIAYLPNLYFT